MRQDQKTTITPERLDEIVHGACAVREEQNKMARELTRLRSLEAAVREAGPYIGRAVTLLHLLTVRQIIHAGDDAIEAAGINPWVMNEGRAEGHESYVPDSIVDTLRRLHAMVTP